MAFTSYRAMAICGFPLAESIVAFQNSPRPWLSSPMAMAGSEKLSSMTRYFSWASGSGWKLIVSSPMKRCTE